MISVIIHTKKEEKNIAECIRSVKGFADEVCVFDMHSTDKTVSIAEKLGAQVFTVKDYGYVEPARNFALKKARGDWRLLLDADERLTPQLAKKLKKIAQENEYDIVEIPFKNIILGHWMQYTAWWPDYKPRFLKKGSVSWPEKIHTHPEYTGKVLQLEPKESNAIIHYNFNDPEAILKRMINYANREPYDKVLHIKTAEDIYNYINIDFSWRFLDKEGFKDGVHGYVMSEYMRMYRFLVFMRYWAEKKYKKLHVHEDFVDKLKEFYLPKPVDPNPSFVRRVKNKLIEFLEK